MQFKNFEAISKNKKESAFIMRKQTKIVAVASAAAILAIGASMTSFAATGWVEESGEWYYYDKDGVRVEDEWKKSGDSWYWLDSEESGAMAMDKLIDDGDNSYYVDSTGKMATNTWVKVVNEDQDEDDDPAEYNYYYMQSNGKAYKASSTTTNTRFKTIDGKKYAFNEDGKMLYGWVNESAERISDEDGWSDEGTYYLGAWDDGAMKTGWQKIYVHDNIEDDDMDHWFYFKSNGKKEVAGASDDNLKEKKVNGKKYGFDERGVMVYEWTLASDSDPATSSNWKYFNSPEDGARMTKGWFKVVAPTEDNTFAKATGTFASKDSDDESERWYYADGDGILAAGQIKKIKGKYYGFREENTEKSAAMLTGLCLLEVDPSSGDILTTIEADMDSDTLDDIIDDKGKFANLGENVSLYYFGNNADSDGAMKTGSTTVTLDGDSYGFMFSKSGGVEGKGRGLNGIDDNKYIYKYGLKMKASSEDKYRVIRVTSAVAGGSVDTGSAGVIVEKLSSKDIRGVKYTGLVSSSDTNKSKETVRAITGFTSDDYLVNTSGAISKKKTAAKDGDDWYFYVKSDKTIAQYTSNKDLKDTIYADWDN